MQIVDPGQFRKLFVLEHYRSSEIMELYEPTGWLEVELGKPQLVGRLKVSESKHAGAEIKKFEVQYLKGHQWVSLKHEKKMSAWEQTIEPIKARKFRLVILDYYGYFGISEFQLFAP